MKPKILVVAQVYLPGYLAGGPVRSIANIVDWLSEDFDWYILTTDRDLYSNVQYGGITVNSWMQVGCAKVFYASPEMCSPLNFLKIISNLQYDLLYLNSFFSPKFSILPLVGRRIGFLKNKPVLLAPRGEFSEGAYRLKNYKKMLFVLISKVMNLHNIFWHASTEFEVKDINRVMGARGDAVFSARVFSARDLAGKILPNEKIVNLTRSSGLRICFLSRISPMKNLDFALKVLSEVKSSVFFDIYGPKEDVKYWEQCENLIKNLPFNVNVRYMGAVENSSVRSTMMDYDLFFLPTRGENFGHVLLEAWSAGLPILTSDQTPWRSLAKDGVGWDLPLNGCEKFAETIDAVASWSPNFLAEVKKKCEKFATKHIKDDYALTANKQMFVNSLKGYYK